MLKVIGLTGTIGSGKSTVSKILMAKDFPVFDADSNVHQLMNHNESVITKIVNLFGEDILVDNKTDNKIDRQKLGSIVLSSSSKLRDLENVLYPYVIENIQKFKQENHSLCFLDIPLLFEKKFERFCDDVLVISVNNQIQEQRVLERPHMTKEKLKQFLKEQMPIKEKEKLATHVIYNNSSLDDLAKNIDEFLLKIK